MASINPIIVAEKVKARVRKGQRVNLGEILLDTGYSSYVSKQPTKVTRTKAYQSVMKPYVARLEGLRDKILRELEGRDISSEEYRILVDASDKFTKNIQLLTGKATENVATVVHVVNYDTPAKQLSTPVDQVRTPPLEVVLDDKEPIDESEDM